jgi:hypothetical protein
MESTPYCCFITGLMKRQPMVVSWHSGAREGRLGLWHDERRARHALNAAGDRRYRLACPDGARGMSMASMPEPHSRLMVCPEHRLRKARQQQLMRATLRLSSPAWLAQP